MDPQRTNSLLDYESRPQKRVTWRSTGHFAAGFAAYCLVAACAALVGNSGKWLSIVAEPAAVILSLAFLAFVVRMHRQRKTVAFTLGVVTGIILTGVAFVTFLVLFNRGMKAFGF